MRLLFTYFFLCCFSWLLCQENNSLTKKEKKFVTGILEVEPTTELLSLKVREPSFTALIMNGDRIFLLRWQEQILGYLFSTRAMGRYEYFDYSILFSADVTVMGLTVTAYRSSHGAAICQKKWLDQFKGYRGEELILGKQIDGIAGATISANSLLTDIRRAHQLIGHIKDQKLF